MDINEILYVGVGAKVRALDRRTGKIIWETALPSWNWLGYSFVSVVFDRGSIFAHTVGRLYCLDAETGQIRWTSNLDGCGYGIASLATANSSTGNVQVAEQKMQAAAWKPTAIICFMVFIQGILQLWGFRGC